MGSPENLNSILAFEVERLGKKYGMPEGTGLDPSNGEFVTP